MPLETASLSVDETLASDLVEVEKKLQSGVRSSLALPRELSERLVLAGGKRIRPLLMCLTYRSLKAERALLERASAADLHTLAAVAEWVHTATLFHDDVIDASPTRRQAPAAHILHGNKVSILVGDFVYAEAFSLLMDRGLLDPSRELASTIKSLVEGELLQHQVLGARSLDIREYDLIAQAKTASLFAWCTGTGAWVAGFPDFKIARAYGNDLGFAFQMADDLLDTYTFNPDSGNLKELTEWVESAPPLPVVLAAESFPKVNEIWNGLKAEPSMVRELQSYCRNESVISRCSERMHAVLRSAEKHQSHLGQSESLKSALKIISDRAAEGIAAAKTPRA